MNIYTKNCSQDQWVLDEKYFCTEHLGKYESTMCQGNGYMGIRAAHEESYAKTVRNTFVAGTFNQFCEEEVTELPNVPDLIELEFYINGQHFDLQEGRHREYQRTLNMKNGLLERRFIWEAPGKEELEFRFLRMVSMDDLHIIGQKIEVKPLNGDVELKIISGIDGRLTNSGSQHFSEGEKSVTDQKLVQAAYCTTQSKIEFVLNTAHRFFLNGENAKPQKLPKMDRRLIQYEYTQFVKQGETATIEKISNIYTSRDKDLAEEQAEIKEYSRNKLRAAQEQGFDELLKNSAAAWWEKIWSRKDIVIDSTNPMDQLALRFAIYHLTVMSPVHDSRMNIGAKGMSGEGYKGHTFWDTEIFMLPYFIFTDPKAARSLLQYRYLGLAGARKKAEENGYEGAMYPWESAWIDDGEVTPKVGGADIVTGKPLPILTGDLEIHITGDIILGLDKYYQCTGDQEFMDQYGYEMILDTAKFWASRLEWNERKKQYEITDVIGPDEYKEHSNNNAYTNYVAHWTIRYAINIYQILKKQKKELFEKLEGKLQLSKAFVTWQNVIDRIYLPKPNENLIIPQDDRYLSLKEIDLTKYRECGKIGTIYDDYNMEQMNEIQVSKQADVVMLLFQLASSFSAEVKRENFYYYEKHCLHDSSLSLAIYSISANDVGEKELSYQLFERACQIDLGPNMKSSDMGIHAASLGGIWQSVVFGFAGVRLINGRLHINPMLPERWKQVNFEIEVNGVRIKLTITSDEFEAERLSGTNELVFLSGEKEYTLVKQVHVVC